MELRSVAAVRCDLVSYERSKLNFASATNLITFQDCQGKVYMELAKADDERRGGP